MSTKKYVAEIVDNANDLIIEEFIKKIPRLTRSANLHINVSNYGDSKYVKYTITLKDNIQAEIERKDTIKKRYFFPDILTTSYEIRLYEIVCGGFGHRREMIAKSENFGKCNLCFRQVEDAFNAQKEVERAERLLEEAKKIEKRIRRIKAL